MSAANRKSCTRCKHVHCTCRGSGEQADDKPEDSLLGFDDVMDAEEQASDKKGDEAGESPIRGDPEDAGNDKKKREPKIGDKILALFREEPEKDWRECQIIDMNKDKTKFYVHWTDFNRRLDLWIDKDKVDFECTKEQMKEIRERKRRFDDLQHERHEDHEGLGEADLKEHEELTKVKNVNKLQFGKYLLETWYFTPLPREIWKQGDDIIEVLYMCEFCLSFYKTKDELERHQKRDKVRHPPGDEIYRNGKVSVFEVDGEKSKIWCQNLCYVAKMFLDHKYLYYDVDPFLFYVVCEYDSQGFHIVGYFSKEKESMNNYNLACILTLPQHQRKGYGKFIINFSYALSKIEKKTGSPEKPLSDLGRVSYESFWARTLLLELRKVSNRPNPEERMVSIDALASLTAFTQQDIKATLDRLQILLYSQGHFYINANTKIIDYHLQKCGGEGVPVDMDKIHWTPHLSSDRWLR